MDIYAKLGDKTKHCDLSKLREQKLLYIDEKGLVHPGVIGQCAVAGRAEYRIVQGNNPYKQRSDGGYGIFELWADFTDFIIPEFQYVILNEHQIVILSVHKFK